MTFLIENTFNKTFKYTSASFTNGMLMIISSCLKTFLFSSFYVFLSMDTEILFHLFPACCESDL